ncbi:MAG: calcium-binding protein [Ornithinimicrobium sp.]
MTLSSAGSAWTQGEERGQFRAVFNGYGTITGDDDKIVLEPRVAPDRDVTHGALVVTTEEFSDVDLQVYVQTQQQLRDGEPNPWEAGWVLWNYTDNDHFYAVALKPNGWEISKQDPAYPGKQRFLASGSNPTFPVGTKHTVNVEHRGAEMTVRVDGEVLDTVLDEERPYGPGAVGYYTEDARVSFTDLTVS